MDKNTAQILGNATKTPELRVTPSGKHVLQLDIATNYKTQEGKEIPEFHRVVVWGKTAEIVSQKITQGTRVFVEGRLQTRSWEDSQGNKKYTTEIVAENVIVAS